MIDSHCHLDHAPLLENLKNVIIASLILLDIKIVQIRYKQLNKIIRLKSLIPYIDLVFESKILIKNKTDRKETSNHLIETLSIAVNLGAKTAKDNNNKYPFSKK